MKNRKIKIPIKSAITSEAWLHCHVKDYHDELYHNFRLKIMAFEKVKIEEIDEPNKILIDFNEGDLWLLKMQIVNLNKQETASGYFWKVLSIIDQDDFEFKLFNIWDGHLCFHSNYAEKSGLKSFDAVNLIPKIKRSGSCLLYLPKDYEGDYFLSVGEGTIQEA